MSDEPKQKPGQGPVPVEIKNVDELKRLVKQGDILVSPSYPLSRREELFLRALTVAASGSTNRDADSLINDARTLFNKLEEELKDGRES